MNSTNFLPDEYSGVPKAPSNYMKLEDGANTFRILSSAVIGYEYWIDDEKGDRKPVRVRDIEDVPEKFLNNPDNRQNAKYFWAFVVYNINSKSIQILELKQKTLMGSIESLVRSKAWGDPKEYNIVITKQKTGSEPRDVEYSVMPEPKEKLDEGIVQLYSDMAIDLNALYKGEDPFAKAGDSIVEDAMAALN